MEGIPRQEPLNNNKPVKLIAYSWKMALLLMELTQLWRLSSLAARWGECSLNTESCRQCCRCFWWLVFDWEGFWKNTGLPEGSLGRSLLVKLLNLHCGSFGRPGWEPLLCGACVASPSTPGWAERDSQHSSSFHGSSTTPECSTPSSLFSRHRIPASTRMFFC